MHFSVSSVAATWLAIAGDESWRDSSSSKMNMSDKETGTRTIWGSNGKLNEKKY
jgi:hypothetical protein